MPVEVADAPVPEEEGFEYAVAAGDGGIVPAGEGKIGSIDSWSRTEPPNGSTAKMMGDNFRVPGELIGLIMPCMRRYDRVCDQ